MSLYDEVRLITAEGLQRKREEEEILRKREERIIELRKEALKKSIIASIYPDILIDIKNTAYKGEYSTEYSTLNTDPLYLEALNLYAITPLRKEGFTVVPNLDSARELPKFSLQISWGPL